MCHIVTHTKCNKQACLIRVETKRCIKSSCSSDFIVLKRRENKEPKPCQICFRIFKGTIQVALKEKEPQHIVCWSVRARIAKKGVHYPEGLKCAICGESSGLTVFCSECPESERVYCLLRRIGKTAGATSTTSRAKEA